MTVRMFEDDIIFMDQEDDMRSSCKGCLWKMLGTLEDTMSPIEESADVYD